MSAVSGGLVPERKTVNSALNRGFCPYLSLSSLLAAQRVCSAPAVSVVAAVVVVVVVVVAVVVVVVAAAVADAIVVVVEDCCCLGLEFSILLFWPPCNFQTVIRNAIRNFFSI